MGEARRRGTFEERRATAIAHRAELTEEYRKKMLDPTAELPKARRRLGGSFTGIQLAAAIAGMGGWGR